MGKKRKPDEKELIKTVSEILEIHPPSNLRKNNVNSFNALNGTYPEIISWASWLKIYMENRKPEAIARDILKESKIKQKVAREYGAGKGGKRGKSKEWINYIKTMMLFFIPHSFLKQYKSNIVDEIKFHDLIRDTHRKFKPNWDNIDKSVKIALLAMYTTLNNFYNLYDEKNPTHRMVLSIIFGESYKLYYRDSSNSPILKGKKVTKKSIMDIVEKVLDYSADQYEGRITKTMQFYFLAYLSEQIYRLLDMHKEPRIEYSLRQIVSILKPLSAKEGYTVLSRLFPSEFPPLQ